MRRQRITVAFGIALIVGAVSSCMTISSIAQDDELETREAIAATNISDAIVVDCQLPGKLRRIGGIRNYLTPGQLIRAPAINCRSRGGEYTLGDLASGTISLQRWMEPADNGEAEAQYLVARIYANGLDNVGVDYLKAASWYEKAADQGHSEAKQELGYLYEQGLGVAQDQVKGLNLQREAAGLGEELDYAYKIDDAERVAAQLTGRLAAANDALRASQRRSQQAEDSLADAMAEIRRQEVSTTAIVAELRSLQAARGTIDPREVRDLEQRLEIAQQDLAAAQASAVELETERDAINAELTLQKLGAQKTQRELRELRARTQTAEQESTLLAARLADSQQRLFQSDEELRELQLEYQQRSEELAAAVNSMREAREQSESDAAAYIATKEAELASRDARIAGLETEVETLTAQLQLTDNQEQATIQQLRREIAGMQERADREREQLRQERERLTADYTREEQELSELYEQSQQELTALTRELESRKRRIDDLSAQSEQLRARVDELEGEQIAFAENSGAESARLQAQLLKAQREVTNLRKSLTETRTEKSEIEVRLANSALELQRQLQVKAERDSAVQRLELAISGYQQTLNTRDRTISLLQDEISDKNAEIADLQASVTEEPARDVAFEEALAVLELAHSGTIPSLDNFHALLIANEEYEHLPDLETPRNDIDEIEMLLKNRYGFRDENVTVLVNVSGQEIMGALHSYTQKLGAEDNLLVYYAGRGATLRDEGYWLGVDRVPNEPLQADLINALSVERVSELIPFLNAQRVLVITDSCFSERRAQKNSLAVGWGLNPTRFRRLAELKARNVLTSGANVPIVYEVGQPPHSLFAKSFIEVLRQNRNVLAGDMLAYEIAQLMGELLDDPATSIPSYHVLEGTGHKGGDFFFVPEQPPIGALAMAR